MPCVDCAGLKIEINALKDFMSQWFEIILKKVEKNTDILQTIAPEYQRNIGENGHNLNERELLKPCAQEKSYNHDAQNSTVIPHTTVFAMATGELSSHHFQLASAKKSVPTVRRKYPFILPKVQQQDQPASANESSSHYSDLSAHSSAHGMEISSFPATENQTGQSTDAYEESEEPCSYLADNAVKRELEDADEYAEDAEIPCTTAGSTSFEEQQGTPRKRPRRDILATGGDPGAKLSYKLYPRCTIRCNLCGVAVMNEFSSRDSHSKTHLDVRPFRCGKCTFCAKKRGDVYRHLRSVHEWDGLPSEAGEGCNLDIITTVNLEEYKRIMKAKSNECFG